MGSGPAWPGGCTESTRTLLPGPAAGDTSGLLRIAFLVSILWQWGNRVGVGARESPKPTLSGVPMLVREQCSGVHGVGVGGRLGLWYGLVLADDDLPRGKPI